MKEFNYDKSQIPSRYDHARKLPTETIELWLTTISLCINVAKINKIVDLGCGTGRFVSGLKKYFGGEVVGIDPSAEMLQIAKQKYSRQKIKFVKGVAEKIPLSNSSADLVFLSMTWHHIFDKVEAIKEIHRVLRVGGHIVVRNATKENILEHELFQFFPTAKAMESKRMPSRKEIENTFKAHGFNIVALKTLKQKFAESYEKYFQKIKLRAVSSLAMISDDEFDEGLKKLDVYCKSKDSAEPVCECFDLLIGLKVKESKHD